MAIDIFAAVSALKTVDDARQLITGTATTDALGVVGGVSLKAACEALEMASRSPTRERLVEARGHLRLSRTAFADQNADLHVRNRNDEKFLRKNDLVNLKRSLDYAYVTGTLGLLVATWLDDFDDAVVWADATHRLPRRFEQHQRLDDFLFGLIPGGAKQLPDPEPLFPRLLLLRDGWRPWYSRLPSHEARKHIEEREDPTVPEMIGALRGWILPEWQNYEGAFYRENNWWWFQGDDIRCPAQHSCGSQCIRGKSHDDTPPDGFTEPITGHRDGCGHNF